MMDRRRFLAGLGAACFAPAAAADSGAGAHPFARLDNPDTGGRFVPRPGIFTLAIFMTAQKIYEDCGSAFGGIYQTLAYLQHPGLVRPVLVMPRLSDQQNPHSMDNLARAKSGEIDFTILTGALPDVLAAAERVDGAFFEQDANGKVSGHTLDGFFLTPSGKTILRHNAADNITLTNTIDHAMGQCNSLFYRRLCQ